MIASILKKCKRSTLMCRMTEIFSERMEQAMEAAIGEFKQAMQAIKGYPIDEEELTMTLLVHNLNFSITIGH